MRTKGFYATLSKKSNSSVQLGPRPFYLVEGMDEGPLKDRLMKCENGPFQRTDFSIGHRGGALLLPEHTDVAYRGGARMGAGIVECDVTFTKDGEFGLPPQRMRSAYDDQYRRHGIEREMLRAVERAGFEPQMLHQRSDARGIQNAQG
jgi:hypothetical protein